MSHSRHARRGTRAGRRVHPHPGEAAYQEEIRQQNLTRIGSPRAGDARRVQAAAYSLTTASGLGDPCCGVCGLDTYFEDDEVEAWWWEEWQERQAS